MSLLNVFPDFSKLTGVIKVIPRKVSVLAVNFSKERFREQGWMDSVLVKWQPRKRGVGRKSDSRAVLVKSGRLRRSIRAVSVSDYRIVIGTDVPYARAHNEGGTWDVTQSVRAHTRKAHSRKGYTTRDGRKISAGKVRDHSVKAFTRKRKINLPKRQFMGISEALTKCVQKLIQTEMLNEMMKK